MCLRFNVILEIPTLARSTVLRLSGRSLPRDDVFTTSISTRGLAYRRPNSSPSSDPYRSHSEPSNLRLGVTLVVFGALGLAVYYGTRSLRIWPEEVRKDLRRALLAKRKGDFKSSAIHFQNAYTTSISLPDPVASFGKDHVLLISSIALALAEALESVNLADAYSVYETALADLRLGDSTQHSSDDRARIRAIGVSLKLGEIGERLLKRRVLIGRTPTHGPKNLDEVEGHWNWAVEETLRYKTGKAPTLENAEMWDSLGIPLAKWTDKLDVAAVLEDAGSFYRRLGKNGYAVPLYLQAISTLYPQDANARSASKKPPLEDRCKGMSSQARGNRLTFTPLSCYDHEQPRVNVCLQRSIRPCSSGKWSQKALEVSGNAIHELDQRLPTENHCLATYAAVLYNLGSICEMEQNKNQAIAYYNHCLDIAISAHYFDGADQARQALKRLGQIRA